MKPGGPQQKGVYHLVIGCFFDSRRTIHTCTIKSGWLINAARTRYLSKVSVDDSSRKWRLLRRIHISNYLLSGGLNLRCCFLPKTRDPISGMGTLGKRQSQCVGEEESAINLDVLCRQQLVYLHHLRSSWVRQLRHLSHHYRHHQPRHRLHHLQRRRL